MLDKFQNITPNEDGTFTVRFALNKKQHYKTFSNLHLALHYRNDFIVKHNLYGNGTLLRVKDLTAPLPRVVRESKVSGQLFYWQVHHHKLTSEGPVYVGRQFSDKDKAEEFRQKSFTEFNKAAEAYNKVKLISIQEQWVAEIELEAPYFSAGFDREVWAFALSSLSLG